MQRQRLLVTVLLYGAFLGALALTGTPAVANHQPVLLLAQDRQYDGDCLDITGPTYFSAGNRSDLRTIGWNDRISAHKSYESSSAVDYYWNINYDRWYGSSVAGPACTAWVGNYGNDVYSSFRTKP